MAEFVAWPTVMGDISKLQNRVCLISRRLPMNFSSSYFLYVSFTIFNFQKPSKANWHLHQTLSNSFFLIFPYFLCSFSIFTFLISTFSCLRWRRTGCVASNRETAKFSSQCHWHWQQANEQDSLRPHTFSTINWKSHITLCCATNYKWCDLTINKSHSSSRRANRHTIPQRSACLECHTKGDRKSYECMQVFAVIFVFYFHVFWLSSLSCVAYCRRRPLYPPLSHRRPPP